MNESLDSKIKIVKGKVSQDGYEDEICTFIKAEENRTDIYKDKSLFEVKDVFITKDILAVTPNVTEALGRAPLKTIGVMNTDGELLVPAENYGIVKLNDNTVAIKTNDSTEAFEVAKTDPSLVQANASNREAIKNKMLQTDPNARFVCDDCYSIYDIYEVVGNKLVLKFSDMCYIATNNDVVYVQSNRLEDEVKTIGKKVEEPNVTMPVGALADVTDKPLDNLDDLPEMPAELPGAPELKDEASESSFNIDEMQQELANFEPSFEMPTQVENTTETEEKEISKEQEEVENKVEEKEIPEEQEEVEDKVEEKNETVFKEPEVRDDYKEQRNKISFSRKYEDRNNGRNDITSLVSAVKAKWEKHEEEIAELQDENAEKERALEDKDDEIRRLQDELSKKDYEIERLQSELDGKDDIISEIKNDLKEKEDENRTLSRKVEKYQENMNLVYKEINGMLGNDNSQGRGYSKRVA